jgi:hypothetical protein
MGSRPPRENIQPGHEPSEVKLKGFLWFVGVFVGVAVVVHIAIWVLYGGLVRRGAKPAPPLVQRMPVPPEPRLQGTAVHPTTPTQDTQMLRQRHLEVLNSYGWSDRQAGIARIPIDRAIDLLLERGLPVATRPAATRPRGRGQAQAPRDSGPVQRRSESTEGRETTAPEERTTLPAVGMTGSTRAAQQEER